jgi:hypothetical protein
LSQQPLFVPAAAGWYACPGDPPQITRHWNGKQWLCEIHGPIRDHFDYLRAMSVQGLSPDDLVVLRQLTAEVSRVEDLALAAPTANPPLVQIAAPPPYVPPPVDPYTSMPLPAHGMAGASLAAGNGQRFAPSGRSTGGNRKIVVAVIAVVGILALVAVRLAFTGVTAFFASTPASLALKSCVTLSYPSGATDAQDVTWTSSDCKTATGGPVSYTVISKLTGSAACDTDSQYVQALTSSKSVAYTYCLMENLTAGQCLYEDEKGFFFDVPCTDVRARIKVSISADQGSNYACPDGAQSWQFPAGNRTYCLTKP